MDREITQTNHALEFEKVSLAYGDKVVLSNLSFFLRQNEILGVVGKSGVGKSTIVKAINENAEYSGIIKVAKNTRTVYQSDNLLNWHSGFKNIELGLLNLGLSNEAMKQKVQNIVDVLSIQEFVHKYPYQMSGGERKRVALARAYVSNPDLILMDEPFSGLDIFTKNKMYRELNRLQNNFKCSVLFISHDIEEILLLCNRVMVLKARDAFEEVNIPFEKPRNLDLKFNTDFVNLRQKISNMI